MSASVWAPDPTQVPIYPALAGSNGASFVGGGTQMVTSRANLLLLNKTSPSQYARVLSYYGDNMSLTRDFYLDLTDTTSLDNGGTIAVAVDGGRWKMTVKDFGLTVNDFGARGLGGVTDDSIPIQKAISWMDANGNLGLGGGKLGFLPGTYNITVPLTAYSGVMLWSMQANDISTNTNGSGNGSALVRWTGAVNNAAAMYTIQPLVVGNNVWGGGSENIYWDGNAAIIVGVYFNNTKFAMFDGTIRSVTYCGLLITSSAGSPSAFSQQNEVRRLEFIYGATSACDNANGCIVSGNGSTVPGTQQKIKLISGLVKNGYGLVISETDNCFIDFVAIAAIGVGGAVLLNNVGFGPSNSNKFRKVTGKISQAFGLYGNDFLQLGSEGGGIVGGGSWDGNIEDYVTGRKFSSHLYQMRKWINIPVGSMIGNATTAIGDLALQWTTIQQPKSASSKVTAMIPADYDLANGNIVGFEFNYSTNTAGGGNLYIRFRVSCPALLTSGSVVTPTLDYTVAIPQATQYVNTKYYVPIVPNIPYLNGSAILASVERLPANALDTATGEVCNMGIRLNYVSLGPDSPGSGTYIVPDWS